MRRRVVVTGVGCVTPLGTTVSKLWANLKEGRSGVGCSRDRGRRGTRKIRNPVAVAPEPDRGRGPDHRGHDDLHPYSRAVTRPRVWSGNPQRTERSGFSPGQAVGFWESLGDNSRPGPILKPARSLFVPRRDEYPNATEVRDIGGMSGGPRAGGVHGRRLRTVQWLCPGRHYRRRRGCGRSGGAHLLPPLDTIGFKR